MFSLNGTLKKSGSVGQWETKQFIGMALIRHKLNNSKTNYSNNFHSVVYKYQMGWCKQKSKLFENKTETEIL